MVQINIDTDKDSPETIAKIIEMLHLAIGSSSTSASSMAAVTSNISGSSIPSSAPGQSLSNPFDMFASESNIDSSSSRSLPSSAPIPKSASSGIFDIFGSEDRPNQQSSSLSSSTSLHSSVPQSYSDSSSSSVSNPFDMFSSVSNDSSSLDSEFNSSVAETNSPAGYADNDLFSSFSNDLPSTDFSSQNNVSPTAGLEASFESAQTLLDDNFNPIQAEPEESEVEPEKKSSNFFSFEQY